MTVMARLNCGHLERTDATPEVGDTIWCSGCRCERTIVLKVGAVPRLASTVEEDGS